MILRNFLGLVILFLVLIFATISEISKSEFCKMEGKVDGVNEE